MSATMDNTTSSAGEEPKETDDVILQMMANDQAEGGDGEKSNVEKGEVDLHHTAMLPAVRRFDEHFCLIDNNLDVDELREESLLLPISGAPDGWVPPGAPITFLGYKPMLDVPAFFADVDNPGHWSEFVFHQPKYGVVEKGRSKKYVDHVTPAGAKVVPMNDDGIHEKNGWMFFIVDGSPTSLMPRPFAEARRLKMA